MPGFSIRILQTSHRCVASIQKIIKQVKFIYSEKATKFCEIFTLLLSYVVPVKSKVKISQNIVAFSEYMNFNYIILSMHRNWSQSLTALKTLSTEPIKLGPSGPSAGVMSPSPASMTTLKELIKLIIKTYLSFYFLTILPTKFKLTIIPIFVMLQ